MMIKTVSILSIFAIVIFCGFKSEKNRAVVGFRILEDTLYYSPEDYQYEGAQYEISITNHSKSNLTLPDNGFLPGYKDEIGFDYYLDYFKLVDGKKVKYDHEWKSFTNAEYPGPFIQLAPRQTQKFYGNTSRYPFAGPGKYYFKVVFMQKYKWVGESNVDSVVVMDKK